jgi:predicted permease
VSITGRPGDGPAEFRYVSPGYFEAMAIPLRRGRLPGEGDTATTPKVLLVNEAFVRQFLPGEDPIGREITDRGTIVGVVADVHQLTLDRAALPEIYYPIAQNFAQLRSVGSSLVVRASVRPESLVPAIRQAVREVNPNQAAFRVATMIEVVSESMGSQRLYAWLLGLFSAIGTGLASAGVYGVMSYLVALRTRELGIRMALGASGGRVLRAILLRGAGLAAAGLVVGLAGALAVTRWLEGALYGVSATDPATLMSIAVLLAGVAVAACVIPARRAARIDPVVALRSE